MSEPGPKFAKNGYCRLVDANGDKVLLSKSVWEEKLKRPERQYLEYNFQKIKDTLKGPDKVRKSKKNPNSKLYYKRYDSIWYRPDIQVPFQSGFVCVVVRAGDKNKFVQTFYPTDKIKK